jgi:hypothetical protein
LLAKSGARGAIQDRYCQGLIASALSHRRTVDGEMSTTTPASIASQASSRLDHRDSGMPRVAGSSQAIAVTCARCTGVKCRGRPDRCASTSPASRPVA